MKRKAGIRGAAFGVAIALAPVLFLDACSEPPAKKVEPPKGATLLGEPAQPTARPGKPPLPRKIESGLDLAWHWSFAGYVGEIGGERYPVDGANGGPDRAYVLAKCQATETMLRDLEPTIQAISCYKRPLYSDLTVKEPTLLEWAKETAPLHEKIFEALGKQPDIVALELMLSDQWSTAEEYARANNFGCALYYFSSPTGVIGFSSQDLDYDVGPLDSRGWERYGLNIHSQNGTEGGEISLATRLVLRCPSPDFEDSAGKAVVTYSFNPFTKHTTLPAWSNTLGARLAFSKDFRTVTRIS